MVVEKKPYQWLAWLATAALVTSATLAAFNIYPLYSYGFIVSNGLWILVGYLWKENSLLYMNLMLTLIYIAGLI